MQNMMKLVKAAFPDQKIAHIHDRGYWLNDEEYRLKRARTDEIWRGRRVIFFQLTNGAHYCLKLTNPEDDSDPDFISERTAYTLLSRVGLPAPQVITVDVSRQLVETSYMIVSRLEGIKLWTLWLQSDEQMKHAIMSELGQTYRRLHAIKGRTSGLFKTVDDPYAVRYPVHPNDFMLQREIREKSGHQAVQAGIITPATYHTVIELWEHHLGYLKDHEPTLIHYSALGWTIGFTFERSWAISYFTGCGDMMWWDPAIDLALFKYAPFMHVSQAHWEAFQDGYGVAVEPQRIALYGLLTTLLAGMGVYHAPRYLNNPWLNTRLNAELEAIIREIA